jgi:hypothetical protein
MALYPRRQNSSEGNTSFASSLPGDRRDEWTMKMKEQGQEKKKEEIKDIQESNVRKERIRAYEYVYKLSEEVRKH